MAHYKTLNIVSAVRISLSPQYTGGTPFSGFGAMRFALKVTFVFLALFLKTLTFFGYIVPTSQPDPKCTSNEGRSYHEGVLFARYSFTLSTGMLFCCRYIFLKTFYIKIKLWIMHLNQRKKNSS